MEKIRKKYFLTDVRFEFEKYPSPTSGLKKISKKMKCSFLDYVQLLMIGQVIRAMKVDQNVKKDPLSHQKMKCSFLDYIQLLMISRVIQAIKVDQNVKKGPLSHQKMKCSFLDYIQLLMISRVIRAIKVD